MDKILIFFNKLVHKIKTVLIDLNLFSYTEKENRLVSDLRKQISDINMDVKLGVENEWAAYQKKIRDNVINLNPFNFLNWPAIRGSMFHECNTLELDHLKKLKDWNRWRLALNETNVGNPRPYYKHRASSGNLIHNAYVLSLATSGLGFDVANLDYIIEFGGGYGSMCRLAFNLGFKGQYVSFDLPELIALQNFFLKAINLNCSIHTEPISQAEKHIALLSDFEQFKKQVTMLHGNGLFIATWSLSESPLMVRNQVMSAVDNKYTFCEIAYHDYFSTMDNILYFNNYTKQLSNYKWSNDPINHLPGNYLLLGKNKKLV